MIIGLVFQKTEVPLFIKLVEISILSFLYFSILYLDLLLKNTPTIQAVVYNDKENRASSAKEIEQKLEQEKIKYLTIGNL